MVFDLILLVLASPVLLVKALLGFARRCRFWQVSYSVKLSCRICNKAISLVGMWRCTCGFTYRGHVLRGCPVCGSLPRMVRCFGCGNTEELPEP